MIDLQPFHCGTMIEEIIIIGNYGCPTAPTIYSAVNRIKMKVASVQRGMLSNSPASVANAVKKQKPT